MNQGVITVDAILIFLLPNFSDILQGAFFVAIFGLALLTMFFVKLRACEENWNKKWKESSTVSRVNSPVIEQAGAEYDSLMDFSQAVSTKPEKLAEIAPGLLLILGLLGTFLGLGLALDHASNILQSASSAASMDGAMDELLKMMGGLGTKFKTSTWGIIAFLLMKGWFAWDGHEDDRNDWCMDKMKRQQVNALDKLKDENDKRVRESAEFTAKEFVNAISLLGHKLSDNFSELQESFDKSLEERILFLSQSIESINSKNIEVIKQFSENHVKLMAGQKLTIDNGLGEVIKNTFLINENLSSFVETNKKSMESISQSSNKMESAAVEISGAAEKMSSAASGLEGSAGNLKDAISGFKDEVGVVMENLDKSLTGTLNKIQEDFVVSMKNGSAQLSGAANLISESIDKLPSSVDEAMTPVKNEISRSVELQKESIKSIAEVCCSASDAITDASLQMLQAKSVIESMGNEISRNLGSIASNNREVRVSNDSVAKGYELISEKVDKFSSSIIGLTKSLNSESDKSSSVLMSLESRFGPLEYLEPIKCNLERITKKLDSLDQSGDMVV